MPPLRERFDMSNEIRAAAAEKGGAMTRRRIGSEKSWRELLTEIFLQR